jgi:hypothetical protein
MRGRGIEARNSNHTMVILQMLAVEEAVNHGRDNCSYRVAQLRKLFSPFSKGHRAHNTGSKFSSNCPVHFNEITKLALYIISSVTV